ncbi:unnamed protein product [Trichobilharzia szidati]|nr:unnamed protein product [Trichobilharzia szidati]
MMLSVQFILLSVISLALAGRNNYTEKIFQMHNEYRKQILECKVDGQPSAKRMPPLIWDEKLARNAEAVTKYCAVMDTIRRFNSYRRNIGIGGTVEIVVQKWFGEHIWYNFKDHKCSEMHQCKQYLQMVFENTTHIGCGVTKCPNRRENTTSLLVVCNYGPGATFHVRPYEANNVNEVCSVKGTTGAVHLKHGQ